jgi:hypothetical protein
MEKCAAAMIAAEKCSREPGDKARRYRMIASEEGYWTRGNPPYGLRRSLPDEHRNPLYLLEPG